MVDKVRRRLASWKKGFFSKAGRLTLLRIVLSGMPVYLFSLFRAPCKICKDMERLMHDFFWEGVEEGKGKGSHLVR